MNLRHCLYPSSPGDEPPPAAPKLTLSESESLYTAGSLQTLPSVPSLQLISLSNHLSLDLSSTSSLQPPSPQYSPNASISSLALSGPLLYSSSGHLIHVYDSHTLSHLHSFNSASPHSGSVKSISLSISPDNVNSVVVFTAHQDSKIRAWKLTPSPDDGSKTHRLISVLPTLSDRLRRLALPTSYVQVRRHKKQLWLHHNDAVSSLACTNLLYSASWDKTLKIWRSSDFRCLESVPAHDDAINAVAVSPDGVIYTGSADRRIRVWARRPGEKKHSLLATLERHRSAVNALALSSDGNVLFSGACDRSILVWEREDTASYMVVAGALRGHGNAILCVVNVSDFLFSGSADRTVRIWRRGINGHYSCLSVLEGHLKPVKSLVADFETQSSTMADCVTTLTVFSGSLDGEIRVWKLNVSTIDVS